MTVDHSVNDYAIVRVTDAGIYYRASALGGCFRALWAARNGHEPKSPPDGMQAIFDRGHEIEDIVLDRMVEDGWNIYDRQREIIIPLELQLDPPCFIVGHIDALGTPPPGLNPADPESHLFEHLIEVKGFGPQLMSQFNRQGLNAFPRYKIQTGAYCRGIPCGDIAFSVYDKEADTYSVRFYNNEVEAWQLEAIVLSVEEMYRTGTLPTCTNEYPCPYYYLHDPKEMPMPLDQVQDVLVDACLNLGEQIKILEDARKMLMSQLKDSINWVEGAPTSYSASHANLTVIENARALNRQKIFQLLTDAEEDPDDYLLPSSGYYLRLNPIKGKPNAES